MSRPRVSRTVAGRRASSSTSLNAAIALRDEPSYIPVGLYGMRLTLKVFGVEELGERACLLDAVVDAAEHDVLDEDLAAPDLPVATTFRQHVGEPVPVVHGHELAAELVGRRVERQREPDGLVHLVDEALQSRAATRSSRRSSGAR